MNIESTGIDFKQKIINLDGTPIDQASNLVSTVFVQLTYY